MRKFSRSSITIWRRWIGGIRWSSGGIWYYANARGTSWIYSRSW